MFIIINIFKKFVSIFRIILTFWFVEVTSVHFVKSFHNESLICSPFFIWIYNKNQEMENPFLLRFYCNSVKIKKKKTLIEVRDSWNNFPVTWIEKNTSIQHHESLLIGVLSIHRSTQYRSWVFPFILPSIEFLNFFKKMLLLSKRS